MLQKGKDALFNLAVKLGLKSPPQPDKREVLVGDFRGFHDEAPAVFPYPDNKIITSKYTAWNFVPKNLFEQFQRLANFYFGVVTVVLLLIDAPVSPVVSILPLAFVITASMVKQGYEDWVRHKADNALNNKEVRIVKDGFLHSIKCQNIRVGDIVRVEDNDEMPADLIFLSGSESDGSCSVKTVGDIVRVEDNDEMPADLIFLSGSESDGSCSVTTANLDGETNLKVFMSHEETSCLNSEEALRSLNVYVECEQPQVDLYKFNGRISLFVDGEKITKSLSAENLLLRGSSLKNTENVYGIAIYTGKDTKMALNSKVKPHKVSTVESVLNRFLVIMLLLLIIESVFLTVMHYYFMTTDKLESGWYLVDHIEDVTFGNAITAFLSFSSLLNYLVPISLYVTMELQKFTGARFFNWDEDMYDKKTGNYAKANTSDLNEDLGQIEYIFADKTGTLTENDMMFRQCSLEGKLYHEVDSTIKRRSESGTKYIDVDHNESHILQSFFLKLALCHTVHVNRGVSNSKYKIKRRGDYEDGIEYQASSPDEKALLEAAFRQKVAFLGLIGGKEMQILLAEKEEVSYTLHHVLEFDATRKRMSVIVEDSRGKYLLLCKGAETSVLNRCIDGLRDTVLHHVNLYAEEGLRTLVIAEKRLSMDEFKKIDRMLLEAKTALDGRDEMLVAAFDEIENGLCCVGATAVEDQLQDQVPETIEYLRHAGIKIWILTGDKIETARNISYSCRHFKRGMRELSLLQHTDGRACREALENICIIVAEAVERGESVAIVVDGQSLSVTMNDKMNHQLFLSIGLKCDAVLCCRLSPLQKSQVVRMMRFSIDRPVTLAIGDGANDVSMIQEAHIGIGVMGKEGTQAVRSSDYAIGRFMFLQKVLLVHGHWYYNRLAILILYFFYKNMAFMNCQLLYLLFNAFSLQTLFHSFSLTFFNVLFTSAPIFIFGIMEQNVPADRLLKYPSFYKDLTRNSMLQWGPFFLWLFECTWHSSVCFFGIYILLPNLGNWMFGACVYHVLLIVLNGKLCLHTKLWNGLFFASLIATIVFYYLVSTIYNVHYWSLFQNEYEFVWLFFDMLSIEVLWAGTPIIVAVAFVPDLLVKFFYLVKEKKTAPSISWRTTIAQFGRKKQVNPMVPAAHMNGTMLNDNNMASSSRSPTDNISAHSFDNECYLQDTLPRKLSQASADSTETGGHENRTGRETTILRGPPEPSMAYAKRASTTTFTGLGSSSYLDANAGNGSLNDSVHTVNGERVRVAPVSGMVETESSEEHFTASNAPDLPSTHFDHELESVEGHPKSSSTVWIEPSVGYSIVREASKLSRDLNSDVEYDSDVSPSSSATLNSTFSSLSGISPFPSSRNATNQPQWQPRLGGLNEVEETALDSLVIDKTDQNDADWSRKIQKDDVTDPPRITVVHVLPLNSPRPSEIDEPVIDSPPKNNIEELASDSPRQKKVFEMVLNSTRQNDVDKLNSDLPRRDEDTEPLLYLPRQHEVLESVADSSRHDDEETVREFLRENEVQPQNLDYSPVYNSRRNSEEVSGVIIER